MAISEESRVKKNLGRLSPIPVEKLEQLQEIELIAIAKFAGPLDELESALGFLRLGFQYGWKPLVIAHSKKKFRKYEQILDINARELFPEETPTSDRSVGFSLSKKICNFWRIASGDIIKIRNRREIKSV